MTYLESLSTELSRVGITGRLRGQILAEFEDHLSCDPGARLGDPAELARQFVDELGTVRARRAAFATFAALALAGTLFAATFLAYGPGGAGPGVGHARAAVLGNAALVLAVIGAEVALVAGVLAAERAFRRRRERVLSEAEATVIRRRALAALVAGACAMAGLALTALEFQRGVHHWWTTAALAAAAAGACALGAATPAVLTATRVRPTGAGGAGDVFDDLREIVPPWLHGRPWAFAFAVAAGLAALITAAGVLQDDPYDGALRGIGDAVACLGGFAVLGRYLGLRAA